MAYTKNELLELSKKLISLRNNKIDLTTGTVLSDIGVDATAQILATISEDVDRIMGQQSLDYTYFTDEEADMLVQSYGLTRNNATYATGTIIFATNTLPSTSTPILIPKGTVVYGSTDGSSKISYITTSVTYITSSSPFNTNTGYYEAQADIKAVLPGTNSNIGIGYINNIQNSISGISAVYNKNAITNGSDIESTEDLLNRFVLHWKGRNRNTENGILAWTYTNPFVKEAVVIGPESDYALRGPGSVDVYVRGESIAQYTQTVTIMSKELILDLQPVIDSSDVIVVANGTVYTIEDGYFSVVKDKKTIYQSSASAHDKLVWTDEGYELIKSLTSYTVSYYYNSLITDLQSMYDNSSDRLITGDILARETKLTYITMEFGITPLSNYDKQTTINLIKSNIQNYVNTLPLNTTIRQSDIVNIIEETDGVSYTDLPFLKFCKVGETEQSMIVHDIESTPLEYFRIKSEDIIIG